MANLETNQRRFLSFQDRNGLTENLPNAQITIRRTIRGMNRVTRSKGKNRSRGRSRRDHEGKQEKEYSTRHSTQ